MLVNAQDWVKKSDNGCNQYETKGEWERFTYTNGNWYAQASDADWINVVYYSNGKYTSTLYNTKFNFMATATGTKMADIRETGNYDVYKPNLEKVNNLLKKRYTDWINNQNNCGRYYYLQYREIETCYKIRKAQESGGIIGWVKNQIISNVQSHLISIYNL